MNRHDKSIMALAILSQNESTVTIRNYRTEFDDSPVTIDSLNSGKRGKKGKSLKDWHGK